MRARDILATMTLHRWRVGATLLVAGCSATTAQTHDAPAAMAGRTAVVAPATKVVVAAPPAAAVQAPDLCAVGLPGMRCVRGGTTAGGVELSPFFVDERPVRVAELAACKAAGACSRGPRRGQTDDEAAEVDWQRARELCGWLGKRLPSEWERRHAKVEVSASEWTNTAVARDCGAACTGKDPQGPCDGVHPCGARRVAWSSAGRVEAGMSARGLVRCASDGTLTAYPPRQIARPWPAVTRAGELSAEQRGVAAGIDQDPIEEKQICGEEVRATWAPALQKGGRATTSCRDPFPYIMANEGRTHVWLPYVANVGGGYVGVASDQNYSLIAAAGSEVAWLLDYDPRVVSHHKRLRALILRSATPEQFVARFAPEGLKESLAILDEVYAGAPELEKLKSGFKATRDELHPYYEAQRADPPKGGEGRGWLADPAHYAVIRAMYEQGRIVPVKGDLMGSRTLTSIAAAARALAVPIRVVYLSNAPSAWGGEINDGFRANLRGLPFDERSLVLQTSNSKGFKRASYWHYNIADGLHVQRLLARPGNDSVAKLLAGRIPTPDIDVSVMALPGADPR
jgi:hypothetical protein